MISLLLLACVGFCVQSCCRRRTGKRRAAALAYTSPQSRGPPPPNGAVGSPYTTTPVIPAPNQTTAGSFRATAPPPNWVDPSLYNGPEYSEENLRFIDSQTSPVPVISPNRPNRS